MKKQMTVGEMIARHHWRDAWEKAREEHEVFRKSELGRAYYAMLNAHARTWRLDGDENASPRAIQIAADLDEEAQRTFLTIMNRAIDQGR